jgi:hypothetical protein
MTASDIFGNFVFSGPDTEVQVHVQSLGSTIMPRAACRSSVGHCVAHCFRSLGLAIGIPVSLCVHHSIHHNITELQVHVQI